MLLLLFFMFHIGPAAWSGQNPKETEEPLRMLSGFAWPLSNEERRRLFHDAGVIELEYFEEINVSALEAIKIKTGQASAEKIAQKLLTHEFIEYVEIDADIHLNGADITQENTPQTEATNTPAPKDWPLLEAQVPQAWQKTKGKGARIALLDSGVDRRHPDLIHCIRGGYNALDDTDSFDDDRGHGTRMAGVIAAADNDLGANGVAPQAELYPVKIAGRKNGQPFAKISHAVKGTLWAARNNIHVANMSFSTNCPGWNDQGATQECLSLHRAINYAFNRGTLFVAAASLDQNRPYPCGFKNVICVSAVLKKPENGWEIWKINPLPGVNFVAPGASIYTTNINSSYATVSGTSLAAAHVSGLAALAASLRKGGPANIRQALEKAARSLGLAKDQEGHGMINAAVLTGVKNKDEQSSKSE